MGSGWSQIYFPTTPSTNLMHIYGLCSGQCWGCSGAPICSRTICATEANYPVYTYTSIIPHQKLIYITVIYYTRSHTSQMCGDKVYYTILHMTPINKMSLTQSYHRRKWERSALLNMTQLVVGSWHSVSGYANVA